MCAAILESEQLGLAQDIVTVLEPLEAVLILPDRLTAAAWTLIRAARRVR